MVPTCIDGSQEGAVAQGNQRGDTEIDAAAGPPGKGLAHRNAAGRGALSVLRRCPLASNVEVDGEFIIPPWPPKVRNKVGIQ